MTHSIRQDRITLKNLKVAAFASEETLCFSATVVFDGKAIADARNDGHGGCTFLRPRKGYERQLLEAEAFAKGLPPLSTDYGDSKDPSRKLTIEITLDILIDHIAGEMSEERRMRAAFNRDIVNKVLYIKDDRLLFLTGVKLKTIRDPDAFFALFRGKHGADTVILNQLPREEAFSLWIRHVVRKSG